MNVYRKMHLYLQPKSNSQCVTSSFGTFLAVGYKNDNKNKIKIDEHEKVNKLRSSSIVR